MPRVTFYTTRRFYTSTPNGPCTSSFGASATPDQIPNRTGSLRPNDQYDVIVVGAGVIGCSTALHVASEGGRVLVLERRHIAAEQSSKSWGFCRVQGRDFAEINWMLESRRYWAGFENQTGLDVDWQQRGHLALFSNANRGRQEAYRKWGERANAEFNVGAQMVAGEQLSRLLPGVNAEHYSGCFTPDCGALDPGNATKSLARLAQATGRVDFALGMDVKNLVYDEDCLPDPGRDDRTTTWPHHGDPPSGRVVGVIAGRGTGETLLLRATQSVVLCTAGWSSEFLTRPTWSRTRRHDTRGPRQTNKQIAQAGIFPSLSLPTKKNNSLQLEIPTIRVHATAGTVELPDFCGNSSTSGHDLADVLRNAPTVWAPGCSFRTRGNGELTIADGGAREEHDVGKETFLHGWRFLPSLAHFWRQTFVKFRRASFPTPYEDRCPDPNPGRLERALAIFQV